MKIDNLTYRDNALKWALEKADFEALTLLVGASGVGKTQILKSILNLKNVASGKSISAIYWEITFETLNGNIYEWKGEYENKGDIDFLDDEDEELIRHKPSIQFESLHLNGKIIVDRHNNEIIFNGNKTVKLPNQQSVIYLLKERRLNTTCIRRFW